MIFLLPLLFFFLPNFGEAAVQFNNTLPVNTLSCTANSYIDSLANETVITWFQATSTTAGGRLMTKNAGIPGSHLCELASSQEIACTRRQTTPSITTSSNFNYAVNTWYFMAYTYCDTCSPRGHMYKGTLTSPPVEVTYSSQSNGTGSRATDSGNPLWIGSTLGIGGSFSGRIATFQVFNRVLSLNEIRAQWYYPHNIGDNSSVLLLHLGFTGLTTQGDWSNKKNSCSYTGGLIRPHVPLRIR